MGMHHRSTHCYPLGLQRTILVRNSTLHPSLPLDIFGGAMHAVSTTCKVLILLIRAWRLLFQESIHGPAASFPRDPTFGTRH